MDLFSQYKSHLNSFIDYMKNYRVDLYAVSVQNEPGYAHEWTSWPPQEIVNIIKTNASVLKTRVIAPESFQYRINLSDLIPNDTAALANLDLLRAHLYDMQVRGFPHPLLSRKDPKKKSG